MGREFNLHNAIPVVFTNNFPSKYINDVNGWGISEDELHSKNIDGTYKLLSLDIDFGDSCSLLCPHCFKQNNNYIKTDSKKLSLNDLKSILNEAILLGLKYVKIIGAGEPFENTRLLKLIDFLYQNGIITSIFTKGHVLGNDLLVKRYYGKYKIYDSLTLFEYLKKRNVSILLGFNSFDSILQGEFVGIQNYKVYIKNRNTALINAVKCGFNEYVEGQKTRLGLIAAPIKPENINDVYEIFKFGRRRNIYVLSCPTAMSGLGKLEYLREDLILGIDSYIANLKELYVNIYYWSITNKMITIKEIQKFGISLYPGCHPCNQVAAGFYLTLKGKVYICPGRDSVDYLVCENIRNKSLKEIWLSSENYKQASNEDIFNYYCKARDGFFFKKKHNFYNEIEQRLVKQFKNDETSLITDRSEYSF